MRGQRKDFVPVSLIQWGSGLCQLLHSALFVIVSGMGFVRSASLHICGRVSRFRAVRRIFPRHYYVHELDDACTRFSIV